MDTDLIQKLLKDSGENDSIQTIINNNNINMLEFIFELMEILFLAGFSSNQTNKKLTGLILINMLNIARKESGEIINNSIYYFNDYNKVKEFFIYIIPNNYTFDKKTITNDINIIELDPSCSNNPFTSSEFGNQPVKMSIDKFSKSWMDKTVFAKNKVSCVLNNYNKFYDTMNKHYDNLYKYLAYYLALYFLAINNKVPLNVNTKLLNDTVDFMLNKPFSNDFYTYFGGTNPAEGKTREQLLQEMLGQYLNIDR